MQLRPLVLAQATGRELARFDARLGREQSLGELEVTHLHREEQDGAVDGERAVERGAERERRLALAGARGEDIQRRRLEPEQQLVEVMEAGCDTGDRRV